MMRKFKEMTWDMHALHLIFFVLGTVAIIIFALHHDNPKLEGEPAFVLIGGVALVGTAIMSFFWCLFEKGEGQYNPATSQDQKHEKTTATH